jgi:pilus assembly protein FimV
MHLRKLILVCGFFCSALLSQAVAALGLGEIQLNSKLNEPLNAEIVLLDTQGLNSDQIIVGLASPADFERNGVDRIFFLTEFQFEVLLNRAGGPTVRVTSRNPVREPFLNFLIEARWPTGRLLREYTLLMDLPTFSETRANAAVTAPAAQRQTTPAPQATPSRPSTAPAATATRPSARAPAATAGVASDGTYAVGERDTLWQVALQVRPDRSHSVHQTMLAIQRLNPDAFIDGNINLLRKGQVLRIPSGDEIQALSQREAVSEVARQNQAWSSDSMGAQLSATRRETAARRDTGTVSGSVTLATPQSVESTSGQGSGDNTGRGRALESQLATSLEELDRVTGENQELSSRVRDLEEQIRTMESLVEVSNAQLRALQLKAAQDDDAVTDTTADTAYEPYISEQVSLDDPAVEEPAEVIEEPVAPAETVAPASVRTVVPPPAAPSLLDTLKDYLLLIVAAIGILVLLVAFVIYRRRQQAAQQDLENDDIFAMDADVADDEVYEEEESFFSEDAADEPDLEAEELPAEAETGDVVGEADIYIAYGKFDQAEEMLLNALAKDPDSIDIRLKLLEVYSQTQDAQKFDRYYAGLIGIAGQPALARAAELRDHIEGADEFVPVEASSVDVAATDETLGLTEAESIGGDEAGAFDDEFLLDDDLDLGMSDETSSLAGAEDEADSFLLDDESLSLADDIKTGDSKYDLSFNETEPEAETERDDFTFDFDLEDASDVGTQAGTTAVAIEEPALKSNDQADDDFAFEFDVQDQEDLESEAAEVQVAVVPSEPEEDDFDFNFEEDNTAPSPAIAAQEEFSVATTSTQEEATVEVSDEELQLPEDADDFNLDMDMGDLDLAALDEEMKDLEADFAGADFELEESADVSLPSDATGGFEQESTATKEFTENRELEEELTFIVDADTTGEHEHAVETLEQEQDAEITFDAEMDDLELSDLEIDTATDVPVIDDRIDEDGVFEEALAGFDNEDADLGQASDEDMDAELDFLADADEAATKLDLARAYIDMGDTEGARDILTEVTQEGNEQQRQEAEDLLSRIDA